MSALCSVLSAGAFAVCGGGLLEMKYLSRRCLGIDNSGHLGCDIQRDAERMSYYISGWHVFGE